MDGGKSDYKDYYYILGVQPNASIQEINNAYQDLFDRFGPHVSVMGQDADAMMKAYRDICEAYEVLVNPAKRKEYDEHNYPHLEKAHLRQLWGRVTGGVDPALVAAAADGTRMDVALSLKEAIKGTSRNLRIDEHLPCKNCVSLKPMQRVKCDQCRGTGHLQAVRNEEVLIPPKAFNGLEVRVPLKGRHDLRTGRNLDLIAVIKINQHSYFSVAGKDISCTVPITVLEAVLGGEIQVPTPTGKGIMKVQPLSQTGRTYRLKGLGLGDGESQGDFLITVQVVIPTQISVDELELYRKLSTVAPPRNPREEVFQKLAAEKAQNP
jgi:DnaJ-class molecular chaperone